MPDVAKRLAGPLIVPSAPGTIYTAPASTAAILRHLRVSNNWGAGIPFYLSIGADSAASRLFQGQVVHPNDVLDWSGWEVLNAGDVLQTFCDPAVLSPPSVGYWTTSTTGGTGLAANTTYYYVFTALNANGETLASNEAVITTGAGTTNSNTFYVSTVPGATSYRAYRGTAAGAENVYYTFSSSPFVDTGASPTAGSPPGANTATVTPLALTLSGVEVS